MPKAGMAMEEGTIVRWFKKEGDRVKAGEPLLEIETDKVTMEIESPASGVLLKILRRGGETVPVTLTIGYIGRPGEKLEEAIINESMIPEAKKTGRPGLKVKQAEPGLLKPVGSKVAATPLARKLAAHRGLNLAAIRPTGSHGEIKARDVETTGTAEDGLARSTLKGFGAVRRLRRVPEEGPPFEGPFQSLPVTLDTKADITGLTDLRARLNEESDLKISFGDLVLKVTAIALKANPEMNACIKGDQLIYGPEINIGIGIVLDGRLIVPVINKVDTLSLRHISTTAKGLFLKAKQGKLGPDAFSGETFTVIDLGAYDILSFTSVFNSPVTGLLGVGAIEDEPKIIDGRIQNRRLMGLSLTFESRAVDVAQSAAFLKRIKTLLENPSELMAYLI